MQSLLGFGGGLIGIPLLSLYMSVQDAVTIVLFFQTLMGFLIFKIHKQVEWNLIKKIAIASVIGLVIGFLFLHVLPERIMAALLVLTIVLHLMKTRFKIDGLKALMTLGGVILLAYSAGCSKLFWELAERRW